jgi:S1-C subfamily serine protease
MALLCTKGFVDFVVSLQLINTGRVVRPYIGIKMLQLNSGNLVEFRKRDPTFPDVSHGILVPHVTVASPAYKAGLRPGDVITGKCVGCFPSICLVQVSCVR